MAKKTPVKAAVPEPVVKKAVKTKAAPETPVPAKAVKPTPVAEVMPPPTPVAEVMPPPTTTPLAKEFKRAGFTFVKSVVEDDKTAHGYTSEDGRALLFTHNNYNYEVTASWVVLHADGTKFEGRTAKEFALAMHPVTLEPHVLEAVHQLGKLTKWSFRLLDLMGDDHYKVRVQLLKTLRKVDKVLVKESGVNNLRSEFCTALGIELGKVSSAAVSESFEAKCKELTKKVAKKEAVVRRAEKAEIAEHLTASARQREVHDGKPILPGVKRLSPAKQREEDARFRAELAARVRHNAAIESVTPIAMPRADALVQVDLLDICLWEDPANGIVLMQLEKPNSQGAICVYNNGSRVAAGVLPTERLNTMRRVSDMDIVRDANQLLHPISASVVVTPMAERHLTALLTHCKENINMATATAEKTKKFAPPANAAKKGAKTKVETKVTATVAKKAAAPKSESTGANRFAGKKYTVISKENGGREGTWTHAMVAAIVGNKTCEAAQAAIDSSKEYAGRRADFGWAAKKGYISVPA